MHRVGQNVDVRVVERDKLAVHPNISLGHVSADLGGERTVLRTGRMMPGTGPCHKIQNTERGAEMFISAPRQMVNPVWFRKPTSGRAYLDRCSQSAA